LASKRFLVLNGALIGGEERLNFARSAKAIINQFILA
jgi:hypothetical protein